ncbi:hypothetical protein [Caldalkalibacillus mannanilyticus]|uniref:hypothetical protein n=1 Tax=Caldalkalibacillus mannanilyticus TaxID=1418 RepID=UPI00046A6387|nr:hypothetical protein [Caldalkalibacillus mannanilyticus]
MLFILGILLLAAIFSLIEIPPLLKKRRTREVWAFSILLGTGVLLSSFHILDHTILNPLHFIESLFKPLRDFLIESIPN